MTFRRCVSADLCIEYVIWVIFVGFVGVFFTFVIEINSCLVSVMLCSECTRSLCCHGDDLVATGLSHLVGSRACQVGWRGGSRLWLPFAGGGWRSSPVPLGPAARTAGGRKEGWEGGGAVKISSCKPKNTLLHSSKHTHTHTHMYTHPMVHQPPCTRLQCQDWAPGNYHPPGTEYALQLSLPNTATWHLAGERKTTATKTGKNPELDTAQEAPENYKCNGGRVTRHNIIAGCKIQVTIARTDG